MGFFITRVSAERLLVPSISSQSQVLLGFPRPCHIAVCSPGKTSKTALLTLTTRHFALAPHRMSSGLFRDPPVCHEATVLHEYELRLGHSNHRESSVVSLILRSPKITAAVADSLLFDCFRQFRTLAGAEDDTQSPVVSCFVSCFFSCVRRTAPQSLLCCQPLGV